MRCHRCKGLMFSERFCDYQSNGQTCFFGWRCAICGEIIDPVIQANRSSRGVALAA